MASRQVLLTLVVAGLAVTAPVAAQTADDPSGARERASRGRAAFDRGDLATGCPLLDDAYRLDDQLLGAGFALAECREKEGKLATAHRIFVEIAAKAEARGEERAAEARSRAAALATRLPRLRVDVADGARALPGLTVTIDGQPWPDAAWGVAEPIDAGPHDVVARADGHPPWSMRVEATDGATVDAVVPLGRAPSTAAAAEPAAPVALEADVGGDPGGVPWATAGLVTAGAGVGLLGLGVVLGLVAKGDYDGVEGCDATNVCSPAGAAERNDARGLADVGTVLFIAGGVLAAGGVTLWLVAPEDDPPTTAAVRIAPGSVTLDGRF